MENIRGTGDEEIRKFDLVFLSIRVTTWIKIDGRWNRINTREGQRKLPMRHYVKAVTSILRDGLGKSTKTKTTFLAETSIGKGIE